VVAFVCFPPIPAIISPVSYFRSSSVKRVAASVRDRAQVVAAIHKYLTDHPVETEAAAPVQHPPPPPPKTSLLRQTPS